jgi:hypothetical protein
MRLLRLVLLYLDRTCIRVCARTHEKEIVYEKIGG